MVNEFVDLDDLCKYIGNLDWKDFPMDLYNVLGNLYDISYHVDKMALKDDNPYMPIPWVIWDNTLAGMRMYVAKMCACVLIGLYQKQRAGKIMKKEVKK